MTEKLKDMKDRFQLYEDVSGEALDYCEALEAQVEKMKKRAMWASCIKEGDDETYERLQRAIDREMEAVGK